jgi:hypothetical protein
LSKSPCQLLQVFRNVIDQTRVIMQFLRKVGGLELSGLLGLGCLAFPLVLHGQTLQRIKVESLRVPANTPIPIFIEYTPEEPNWCGLTLDFGDGDRQTIRIGHEQDKASPLQRMKSFPAPGTYVLKVEGTSLARGLRSAVACRGNPQPLVITVFDAEKERAAEAEAKARLEAELRSKQKADEALKQAEEQRKALEQRELELKRKELELREQAIRRQEEERKQAAERRPASPPPQPATAPQSGTRPPVKAADGF